MPGTVPGMGVVDWRRGTPEPTYMELTLTSKRREKKEHLGQREKGSGGGSSSDRVLQKEEPGSGGTRGWHRLGCSVLRREAGVRGKGRAQSCAAQGKGWIAFHDGGRSSASHPGGASQMLTQDPGTGGPGGPQQDEVEGDGGRGREGRADAGVGGSQAGPQLPGDW